MRFYRQLLISLAIVATASTVFPTMTSASFYGPQAEITETYSQMPPVEYTFFPTEYLLSHPYNLSNAYIGIMPVTSLHECEYTDDRGDADIRMSASKDSNDHDCDGRKKKRDKRDKDDEHDHDDHEDDDKYDHDNGKAPVPEPSTFLLVGSSLAGLALFRRFRK